METQSNSIIEQCSQLFMRLGIKSLTMDEVSKQLRISKKTLYQFVSDKSDLVRKCIQSGCKKDQEIVKKILNNNYNAIDEIYEISKFVLSRLNGIHPSIFFDLERYHPDALKKFEDHMHTFVAGCIADNLTKGIQEGYYRADLNIPIITRIYLNSVEQSLHGDLFRKTEYIPADIYKELFCYHVRGIASEKGLDYLIEKIKKEKLNS